jgi:hypothetical protein
VDSSQIIHSILERFNKDFSPWDLLLTASGAVFTFLLKLSWDYLRSSKGEYTGTWQQTIPPYNNEPEKIAIVKIKHIGDKLICSTLRTSPKLNYRQEWKVEARAKRNLIFGIYWPIDGSKLPGSYGTLQFHIVNENLFDGFYVRAHAQPINKDGQYVDKLSTIPLRWERIQSNS